jgi:SulP family sulfate permease
VAIALLLLRRVAPLVPAALIVVAGATAITGLLHLDTQGVSTVGPIPSGLPTPAVPAVDPSDILALLPVAAALAIVGYAESASVAQDFARRERFVRAAAGVHGGGRCEPVSWERSCRGARAQLTPGPG